VEYLVWKQYIPKKMWSSSTRRHGDQIQRITR